MSHVETQLTFEPAVAGRTKVSFEGLNIRDLIYSELIFVTDQ